MNEVNVSVLGKGLSTGTEIEYSDAETLANALKSRTKSNE
jgi:recombinational DNA repair protein RecR